MSEETKEVQGTLFPEEQAAVKKEVVLEDKPMNTDMQRVASTMLIEAAMIYRRIYVPKDAKNLDDLPMSSADELRTKGTVKLTDKGARKIHADRITMMKKSMLGLNDRLEKELKVAISKMDKNGETWIKEAGFYVASAMKELIDVPDRQEALTLLRMYRAGDLDVLFAGYRAEKEKQRLEAEDKSNLKTSTDETTPASAE